MTSAKKSAPDKKNVTTIRGDVVDSVIVTGDNNTTFFQKIINYIFPSEKETLEQRNRRILLGHVENAWIKGVLDASLHGAALLDLGIKQDPEAVTQYPWAIKKESTDETLPAGTSMLEIFDSIGMGRSLLILGAPGSGKTTILLELARGLIARAREDVTQPIPMVFNLASWTGKLTLADWLAQELNNLYSVPRKTAPDWVKGNKLLLLLDGLDEVRQDSRAKCVEAINAFRKEHGLTSLAVCSRTQDYADLKAKLSFEGAIEVQPLTQEQIAEFFNRFGDEMAGIKQALEKDSRLCEMAETPLFLSIMLMAYRDKQDVEILISGDEKARRKHLFDTYIERMFEHPRFDKKIFFKKQNILKWLSWLAVKMIDFKQAPYFLENMQFNWLANDKDIQDILTDKSLYVDTIDSLFWDRDKAKRSLLDSLINGLPYFFIFLSFNFVKEALGYNYINDALLTSYNISNILAVLASILSSMIAGLFKAINAKQVAEFSRPGERLIFTLKNSIAFIPLGSIAGASYSLSFILYALLVWFFLVIGDSREHELAFLINMLYGVTSLLLLKVLIFCSLLGGVVAGFRYGGLALIKHYILRIFFARNNLLPWKLIPFLDHCVDLIFLRRVGGGYIFIHRLLMEHFAEMYVETPTSKGN